MIGDGSDHEDDTGEDRQIRLPVDHERRAVGGRAVGEVDGASRRDDGQPRESFVDVEHRIAGGRVYDLLLESVAQLSR